MAGHVLYGARGEREAGVSKVGAHKGVVVAEVGAVWCLEAELVAGGG